jgi:hypothetical protein
MQRITAFFNQYRITISVVVVVFWLVLIYTKYRELVEYKNFDENKGYFIFAFVFLLISFFNLGKALKAKRDKK